MGGVQFNRGSPIRAKGMRACELEIESHIILPSRTPTMYYAPPCDGEKV